MVAPAHSARSGFLRLIFSIVAWLGGTEPRNAFPHGRDKRLKTAPKRLCPPVETVLTDLDPNPPVSAPSTIGLIASRRGLLAGRSRVRISAGHRRDTSNRQKHKPLISLAL